MTRRLLLALLVCLVPASTAERTPIVTAVDSIGMTVSDLDRSIDFYTHVLNFEKVSEHETAGETVERETGVFGACLRTARLRLGDEFLELTEFVAPRGRQFPVASRGNDLWFQHIAIIVSDMHRAYRRLREFKVEHASTSPQRLPDWNANAGGIQAFYFRDPDGHFLEILSFPEGKGQSKWHTANGALFMGIDHTAIVVSDTEASLRFYRGLAGLNVAGESFNHGVEQEHLNNVFGARLRITALRADAGPGVELIEYVAPRDGRPFPPDARSNDLLHWHTRFLSRSADEAAQRLQQARSALISSGVITRSDEQAGYRKSVMARDPDGHAVQFIER